MASKIHMNSLPGLTWPGAMNRWWRFLHDLHDFDTPEVAGQALHSTCSRMTMMTVLKTLSCKFFGIITHILHRRHPPSTVSWSFLWQKGTSAYWTPWGQSFLVKLSVLLGMQSLCVQVATGWAITGRACVQTMLNTLDSEENTGDWSSRLGKVNGPKQDLKIRPFLHLEMLWSILGFTSI